MEKNSADNVMQVPTTTLVIDPAINTYNADSVTGVATVWVVCKYSHKERESKLVKSHISPENK